MNAEMESELTEMYSRTDNLAVFEDANVDEAIPTDLLKEQSIEVYKETTSKNINIIYTYKTRKKVNTTKWRPIYEVIDKAYIKDSKIFPDDFIRECKNNSNGHNLYHAK